MKKTIIFGIVFLMMMGTAFALTGNLTIILDDTYVATEDASDHASVNDIYIIQHPTYEHRDFIKWNISSFNGVNVNDATVWIYIASSEGNSDFGVYDVQTESWSEHMAWADNPCGTSMNVVGGLCNSTATDSIKTITGIGWIPINVTTALKRATKANWNNFSLVFVGVLQIGSNFQSIINSKESGNGAYIEFSYIIPPESTPPVINSTSINNSLPQYNDVVELSTFCSDNVDIANIEYSSNISGSWATISSSGAVSNPYNYSVTAINNKPVYTVVGNKFTCYDSASNSAESAILAFTSQDNVNPVVAWQNPTPADASTIDYVNVVFNISVVEPNLNQIIFNYNGTNETGTFVNNFGNYWSLPKTLNRLGLYTYSIYVSDLAGNYYQSTSRTFTLDNVIPSITWTKPANDNSTSTTRTGNINARGDNINLNIGNLSVFYAGNLIYNNIVTGINAPTYTFTDSIPAIFNSQPDGIYVVEVCFEDYSFIRKCEERKITIYTPPYVPPNYGIRDTLSETGYGIGSMLDAIRMPIGQFALFLGIIGAVVALIAGLLFAIKKLVGKHL